MNDKEDILSQTIVKMFYEEHFYAELILQMDRIISNKVPTAGVCVKNRVQLYVNPDFFASLTPDERVAVLKHECQHIINDHINRAKDIHPEVYSKKSSDDVIDSLINGQKHKVLNIAADLSINSGIRSLPKDCALPESFNLESGHTFEWYIENLKNNEKLKEMNEFDDHSIWSESEGDRAEIKEKIKQAVKKAAEKTRAAGKMTTESELTISRLNYKPKDWKGDLKRFAARTVETKVESSKKKRNRRYGVMYPGTIKEEVLNLGVAIDTSGSVSDEALNQFMAEISNISKYATITVVEADSEVKNVYKFDPKKVYTVKGRGGTAYQPAFDYFTNNEEIDGVIYFGDMDCFEKELIKPKYPVLWAVVGDQEPPAQWGMKTKVEIVRKKGI